MKDIELFDLMGQKVTITGYAAKAYVEIGVKCDLDNVIWKTEMLDFPRVGWIVGRRILQGYKIVTEDVGDEEYVLAKFSVFSGMPFPCMVVSLHPRMRTIFVPDECFEIGWREGLRPFWGKLSMSQKNYERGYAGSGADLKRCFQEHPEWYPRDKKGRFLKKVKK